MDEGQDFAFDFEAHLAEDEKNRQVEFQQRQHQLQQQHLQPPPQVHHEGQLGGGVIGRETRGTGIRSGEGRGILETSVPSRGGDAGSQLGGRKHPAPGPAQGTPGVKRAKATHYVVCRHWLRGMCIKGEHCDFLHIFDPNRMPLCRQYRKTGRCLEYEQGTCPLRHELEDETGGDDGGSSVAETQRGGDGGAGGGGGRGRRQGGGGRRGDHADGRIGGGNGSGSGSRRGDMTPDVDAVTGGGDAGGGPRQMHGRGDREQGDRRAAGGPGGSAAGTGGAGGQPGQSQQPQQQQLKSQLVCLQYLFGFCTYGPQCAQRHVNIRHGQRPRIPLPDWYLRLLVLSPPTDNMPMMDPVAAFHVSRRWQEFAESFVTREDQLTAKVSKRSLLEMLPAVPVDCPVPPPARISELKVRTFVIKSVKIENILTSIQRGIWATGRANVVKLLDAYMTCHHVVLLMSANESGGFQGYARMSTPPDPGLYPGIWGSFSAKLSPNFRVRWLKQCKLDFETLGSFTNPWNEHKPLRKSRDGQEMPYELATAVCQRLDSAPSEDLLVGTPLQHQSKIDHNVFFDLSPIERHQKEVELGLRNPVERALPQHIQQMKQYAGMLASQAGRAMVASVVASYPSNYGMDTRGGGPGSSVGTRQVRHQLQPLSTRPPYPGQQQSQRPAQPAPVGAGVSWSPPQPPQRFGESNYTAILGQQPQQQAQRPSGGYSPLNSRVPFGFPTAGPGGDAVEYPPGRPMRQPPFGQQRGDFADVAVAGGQDARTPVEYPNQLPTDSQQQSFYVAVQR